MILKMIDVEYKYKNSNKLILKDINVEFEKGKVYVIKGKSGSGKSVLLGIISGLDDCTSGNIIYKEKNLKYINRGVYRNSCIGVIFKDYNLLSNTTILDNILLPMIDGRKKKQKKRELIDDILKIVGIDKSKLNIKVEKISDEEKKKVCIAKALCNNPELIISDDIIENCNDKEEKNIIDIFIELAHKYNKCVIVATNSYIFGSYADELWGMINGKLMYIKEGRVDRFCTI